MTTPSACCWIRRVRQLSLVLALCAGALLPFSGRAATPEAKHRFDLAADDAAVSLKRFSEQSGEEIVYRPDMVRGIRTNLVKGEYDSLLAVQRMLEGTDLVASRSKNGILAIYRSMDPNGSGAAAVTSRPPEQKQAELVSLNPFEVKADSDNSYGALNSNSVTRFNVELSKMPLSADIFTKAFMTDMQPNGLEDLITTYSAGAGINGSDSGGSAASNQPGDRNGNYYIALRGLATPVTQRDSFMPVGAFGNPGSTGVGYTSLFDTERAELIRGPQALLYAGGGAGGVINTVSNQARFGLAQGSVTYKIDQYGSKQGVIDDNFGGENVAVRVDVLEQKIGGRRENIGGTIHGVYGQFAVKFYNTTVRLNGEQTYFNRIVNSNVTATLPTGDTRTGDELTYLLATNQTGTTNPVTGAAYPGGAIANGNLNWGNVNSFGGWQDSELVYNTWGTLTADSKWNSWLSSEVAVGYDDYRSDRAGSGSGPTLLGPGASGNTFAGWAATLTPSDSYQPARTKSLRAFALATNDFFGGKAHSQTIFGGDFLRTDFAQIAYGWFQADSNFNPIVNGTPIPGVTANGGRTPLTATQWSVDGGPLAYPLWGPRSKQITVNGVNYIRQLSNPPNASIASLVDPQGVILGGSNYIETKLFNKGIFGMNSTDWMDGRLNTMVGFRYSYSDEDRLEQGNAAPIAPQTEKKAQDTAFNYSLGANFEIVKWLRAYVEASNSYDPPPVVQADPIGNTAKTAHAVGEEAGLKFNTSNGAISGSLAFYHVNSKNEEFLISSTLENDIDPSGLNGKAGGANQWVNLDRTSQGVELSMTAAPTSNWRLRLSAADTDGKTLNTKAYDQTYNDQFYEDKSGNVTYADGSVVYVSTAATAKSTAGQAVVSVPTGGTPPAGAVPLTVALMNTQSSVFWANPASVTGAINSTSLVANILKSTDPTHGTILTGVAGLPISQIQINPLSNPANIPPPGNIVTAQAGDLSLGYYQFSANMTNVYSFSNGFLKGLRVGGTTILGWRYRDYYYYPTGIGPGANRVLRFMPDEVMINALIGYSRKVGRIVWSTQLNVSNLFNRYHLVFLPGPNTGWTANGTGINVTFDQQPRSFTWTNTISF